MKQTANIDKFNMELDSYVDKKQDYKSFWENIRLLNCIEDYRWCFFMAHHAYKIERDIKRATYFINLAVEKFEDSPKEIVIETIQDFEKIAILNIHTVKNKSIYSLAGEIYSQFDKNKSLHFYQLMQLSVSNLKPIGQLAYKKNAILYSFRPVSQFTLADLINNEITVSPIKVLNDPFDCIATLWASEDNLGKMCMDKNHISPLSHSFDYYRIRSFVANTDTYDSDDTIVKNKLMWSHYADKHKGICIKYNLSSSFIKRNNDTSCLYLRPVIYGYAATLNVAHIKSGIDFCFKSLEWAYEKEVRLVSYDFSTNEQWTGIPLDKDSKIEAIYFGYSCSPNDKKLIKRIFKNKNVKFYDITIDPNGNIYNLLFKEDDEERN